MFFWGKNNSSLDTSIVQSLGVGVVVVSLQGICRYVNAEAARMLGFSVSSMIGTSLYDRWQAANNHDKDCRSDACPIEATLKDKKTRNGECVFLHKDKTAVPVQCISAPFTENGKTTGVIITFFDTSEQKELERIAKENRDLLQIEFDTLPVGCAIWSDQFSAITWNPMCQKIFGYSAREALGKKPADLFVPVNAPAAEVGIWKSIPDNSSTVTTTTTNRTKDGRTIYCRWNLTRLTNPSGGLAGVLSTVEDITAQTLTNKELEDTLEDLRVAKASVDKKVKERTRELAEAKAKEDAILASIGEGIVVVDKNGSIIFSNEVMTEMVGLPSAALVGKKAEEVLLLEDAHAELVVKEKNPIWQTLANNARTATSEFVLSAKEKNVKFPVYISTSPVVYNKKVIGVVQAMRDITKEKELEHAKSDFVSIASHQLRTPLSSIRWVLDVMREESLSAKQKEYVESLYASNQRLVNLVDDLLNTSRIESGNIVAKKESVNLKETVDTLVKTLAPAATAKKQDLKISVSSDVDKVTIDTKLFEMAFNNLLSNAISYSPENLPVTVVVENKAKNCTVSVNNLKPVIPDAEKPKIFSKFFRADGAKKIRPEGTGLGVFIAKSSVETSGGKMWFESSEAKGTTFYFTIPTV